jgi:Beta-propeller repeat
MVRGISTPTAPANSNANLCWSTYFGGGREDYVKGVDVDINGNRRRIHK